MKKTKLVSMILAAVMAISFSACGAKTDTPTTTTAPGTTTAPATPTTAGAKVFKLGHIAAPNTAYDNFANKFAELVAKNSNGRYEIDVYPSGQLGVDRELMESLQAGNVDFTVITASDISSFVPDASVQDLPYLFSGWEHVEKFLASDVAQDFYKITDSVGMTTLALMPRGFRHVTSNTKPVNTPADLKGMKLRVAESEIYINTFKALGANAQAMAWSEVYTALQQGTVEGHENTAITIRDYKINEVQKYLSLTGHFFAFAALQMNADLLKGMSADDQKMIRDAAAEASKLLGAEQRANEAKVIEELKSKGMTVNEVADKAAFSALLTPVYDEFFKSHDRKFFDAIKGLDK
ncbi:MAG: TRAP transporter substrate-binding protein [Youngiibacter sp.]|nr:TRAP transporter substrate-binding protein [Youngiibacter sp.]